MQGHQSWGKQGMGWDELGDWALHIYAIYIIYKIDN